MRRNRPPWARRREHDPGKRPVIGCVGVKDHRTAASRPPRLAFARCTRRPAGGLPTLAPMFPQRLTDTRAYEIAVALRDGFNRHYRLFREASAAAKQRFERADWHGQQRAQRERIEFYDMRVNEAVGRLRHEFAVESLGMDTWQQAKLHYIGLLTDHHQPELAETFFNSVTSKLLHRSYFSNDFIFVRPAVSTEYIEDDEPGSASPPTAPTTPHATTCTRPGSRIVDQLPARGRVRGSWPRRRPTWCRPCSPSWAASGRGRTSRSRCWRACSTGTRAPTSSARSSTASWRFR